MNEKLRIMHMLICVNHETKRCIYILLFIYNNRIFNTNFIEPPEWLKSNDESDDYYPFCYNQIQMRNIHFYQ